MTVPDWVSVEHRPPHWIPRDNALSVNRYADVAALLRHPDIRVPELGRNIARLAERANRSFPNLVNLVGGWLSFHNPPMHTRLREFLRQSLNLLAPALGVEAIRVHVRSLLDTVRTDDPMDAVTVLANRLPIRVMAGALDLPEQFIIDTRETNYRLNRVWHYAAPIRVLERLEIEATELFTPVIDRLRSGPKARGLRALAAFGKDRFDLTEAEIAASAFFLIMAGIVTTSGMLSAAIFFALSHPAALPWRPGDQQAVKGFLDEVMRMAAPLRQLVRVAGCDVTLPDIVVEGGTAIILKIEEAHRDPAAYAEPGRFDPARRGPPHLGFSAGGHACLGAAIAYREAAILIEELFGRFDVELLDSVPCWEDHPDFRRLPSLSLILRVPPNGRAT